MSKENEFAEVERLYNEKDYAGVLTLLQGFSLFEPLAGEVLGWVAWCDYRMGNPIDALQYINSAGDNQRALLCKLYIFADCRYQFGSIDRAYYVLAQIEDKFAIARAFIDFARDENSVFWRSYGVMAGYVMVLAGQEGVEVGHLFRDAAQVYADSPDNRVDLMTALGFLEMALIKYGRDKKVAHHFAGVCRLMSEVCEKLGDLVAAEYYADRECSNWLDAYGGLVLSKQDIDSCLDNSQQRCQHLDTLIASNVRKKKKFDEQP